MNAAVTVDVAGAQMGGAARLVAELHSYLARTGRDDVQVIGASRRVDPAWLVRREAVTPVRGRRVALNNVSFVATGGERWTLLRNALHFLTGSEAAQLGTSLTASTRHQAAVVRMAARRSDVLVAPCSAMAERVSQALPSVRGRIVVRLHPVSADSIPTLPRESVILCPVLFAPFKRMSERLAELIAAIDSCADPSVRLRVTADRPQLPSSLARHPRIDVIGRVDHAALRLQLASSRAIYFPTGLESFGYPLAEARASGKPVIARDTAQNREIAGPALCGFRPGDASSLRAATNRALKAELAPDPTPFDPDTYFNWLLGPSR